MTSTWDIGRLGNQIIRNLAVSLLAKKHDLKVDYWNRDLISRLGIELFSGNSTHSYMQILNDDNYFDFYNSECLQCDFDLQYSYFQTKEITNMLYRYLHTDEVKSRIIAHNPFRERYEKNNDLYIHIRLTDASRFNPGITYYINAIQNVQFDNLYISTDEPEHDIIKELLQLHPSAQLLSYDEIMTFQFASTCKHIILSHGSFSAVIGYLSFFSTVYYPEYEPGKVWYGDMFSIDGWIQLKTG